MNRTSQKSTTANLVNIVRRYEKPSLIKSFWQLTNTLALFIIFWLLMLYSLGFPYWITLLLAIPTAGMVVRLFIIQHDCGHGSFFRSKKACNTLGFALGVLTLYPFGYWRKTHAIHHATSGDLGRRGFGALETLTIEEYRKRSKIGRLLYRLYRNPFVLFGIGPLYQFAIKTRLPLDLPRSWKREWKSVWQTNVAVLLLFLLMWQAVGLDRFLLVHLPVVWLSGAVGVWLFYIQHQFEDTYWEESENWDYHRAAFEGSSYYDLPAVLHWFTGNIGIHHLHHLSSKIPNYRLLECFYNHPELRQVTRLTLWESLKCIRLKLWDTQQRKLVGLTQVNR